MSALFTSSSFRIRLWNYCYYLKNFRRNLRHAPGARMKSFEGIQQRNRQLNSEEDQMETFSRNRTEIPSKKEKKEVVASEAVKKSFQIGVDTVEKYRKKTIEKFIKTSQDHTWQNIKLSEKPSWYTSQPDPLTMAFVKKTEDEVFEILKDSIIYDNYGLVVLNKPHGLACQFTTDYFHHIQKYIPRLAQFVDSEATTPDLYPVHRLDIGTTGVFLLAKNQETFSLLSKYFRERKIKKTYWAITRGVPLPPTGTIDAPIAEGSIENSPRMVVQSAEEDDEELSAEEKLLSWRKAVTDYRVLTSTESLALVELHPKTGITHQLRVHLGFSLKCPALGDHKYSDPNKLGPQKLPEKLLKKFNLEPGKEQCLPIFLHSRSVVVPQLAEGRDVFIQAPLPRRFVLALKKLKLNRLSSEGIDLTDVKTY